MKWILLAGAILSGVTASLSLKAALDNPVFFIAVILGYSASFAFLAGVLRKGLGLGVAYGIWAALGITLTALLAAASSSRRPSLPSRCWGSDSSSAASCS